MCMECGVCGMWSVLWHGVCGVCGMVNGVPVPTHSSRQQDRINMNLPVRSRHQGSNGSATWGNTVAPVPQEPGCVCTGTSVLCWPTQTPTIKAPGRQCQVLRALGCGQPDLPSTHAWQLWCLLMQPALVISLTAAGVSQSISDPGTYSPNPDDQKALGESRGRRLVLSASLTI